MARDTWFETVSIAQERAKKRPPKSAYSALLAGSEKGLTYSDNVQAFGELGFAPHVIGATEKRDLATTVMGQDISMPVLISPTGVQAVHPDGEVAVARAAAARGTAMGLSSFASKPIEEVVAAMVESVLDCLSEAPPELAQDLIHNGIHLVGGGGMLRGLDARLADATKVPVRVVDAPLEAVVLGAGRVLENFDSLSGVFMGSHGPR